LEAKVSDPQDPNSISAGGKLPVLPVLLLLVSAMVGALTTWIFVVDARVFELARDVPTRTELQVLRADLTVRLDRIETSLSAVLASSRPSPSR
jgi:hypothetical protein